MTARVTWEEKEAKGLPAAAAADTRRKVNLFCVRARASSVEVVLSRGGCTQMPIPTHTEDLLVNEAARYSHE